MEFFKYYSANPYAESKDIMAPLRYHSIRYSSPELFNDPYDCKCFFEDVNSERKDPFSEKINSHLKIASLSRNPTSPIMWAHYATDHKGYVIHYDIYDAAYKKVEYKKIKPSYYSSKKLREDVKRKYPNIVDSEYEEKLKKFLEDSPIYMQKLKDAIFIKHLDWKYEEEYRLMHTKKSGYSSNYIDDKLLPKQIKNLILGYRFDHDKNDSEIKSIIHEVFGGNLKVYKAEPCMKNYKMIARPYTL